MIEVTNYILIFAGLAYVVTLTLREYLHRFIIINSIPSFTGAIVFSAIFKRKFSENISKGRFYQYSYAPFVLIIMMLVEINQMNKAQATFDINDVVAIISGTVAALLLFELERKRLLKKGTNK